MHYSLYELLLAYQKNKNQIDCYLSGKTIEHNGDGLIFGMTTAVFVVVLLINIAILVAAIYLLLY